METCYRMYTWMCRTIVWIMLQMFWKMRQISDYFDSEESNDIVKDSIGLSEIKPLNKQSKHRRHIRSMSDVQSSTPYYSIPSKHTKKQNQHFLYDSDSRIRRSRLHGRYPFGSSDSSSETGDQLKKAATLEQKLAFKCVTRSDSMRYV